MTQREVHSVCVFCGSKTGSVRSYSDDAHALGIALGQRGLTVVFGGDRRGLMGVVADAALSEGARVIGVLPKMEIERGFAHPRAQTVVVADRLLRKREMATLSDAFIALPGGLGTLDELFEMLTWSASGAHDKPCIVINTAGYYDDLVRTVDRAVEDGFVSEKNRQLFVVLPNVPRAVGHLFPMSSAVNAL